MKKMFAFLTVCFLFGTYVFAAGQTTDYSYDQSQSTAKCYVLCPLEIDPDPGDLDLGVIRPGEMNKDVSSVGSMQFNIDGGNGAVFGAHGTVAVSGNGPAGATGTVELEGCVWTYDNGSVLTIGNTGTENEGKRNGLQLTGTYGVKACNGNGNVYMTPGTLSASSDATMGDWTFDVMLEVDYQGF